MDPAAIQTLLKGINARAAGLRKDFNAIKEMYYSGKTPPQDMIGGESEYKRVAHAFDPIHDSTETPYTIKTATIVDVQTTPLTQTQNAVNAVATSVQTPTAPATTTISPAVNDSGGENATLIAKWKAYGFTGLDKGFLKSNINISPVPTPSIFNLLSTGAGNMVTIGGRSFYVGIQWPPSICDKARIVGEIGGAFFGFFNTSREMDKLREYYGVGLSHTEYTRQNNQRKAELLDLADKIVALERSTGAIY
jgi:hypothetical protein